MPGQIICVSCPKRHPSTTPHPDGKDGKRRWLVKIYKGEEERLDTQTGQPKIVKVYVSKAVHGTKKDAQQVLNAWLPEKDRGTLVQPSRVTLSEYLDRWMQEAKRNRLRKNTFASYTWVLNHYVRPNLGHYRLNQITPLDIQGLYTKLAAPKPDGQGLAPRTVRYTHTVLSQSLKQAVRWRLLTANPALDVELPKPAHEEAVGTEDDAAKGGTGSKSVKREIRALSPEEVATFQKAAQGDPLEVLFLFALATGMRPSEYLGLQWQDVDLKAGKVVVRRVIVQRAGTWFYDKPKTKKSRRTIPLPATVVQALKKHYVASPYKAPTDPVFASHEGKPLDQHSTVTRRFKAVLKKAKLPATIRLYDLRHTMATLLLLAGENPKVVSERLGHASISITLDTYSHVLPTMQEQAAEKLDAILAARNTGEIPGRSNGAEQANVTA